MDIYFAILLPLHLLLYGSVCGMAMLYGACILYVHEQVQATVHRMASFAELDNEQAYIYLLAASSAPLNLSIYFSMSENLGGLALYIALFNNRVVAYGRR